ncbi:hypothetical protein M3Y97_00929200 [Aphelenchoides bicaudatus]|nr:hypothetical protein M3Y97_00929200 [Aphelenchoides bicaudatus]
MKFLSAQYAIDTREEEDKFQSMFLFDVKSGEKKDLSVEGAFPTGFNNTDYKLEVLDSSQFLFITNSKQNIFTVFLFKIDYKELKVTLLDKQIVIGRFVEYVSDAQQSQKFVLRVTLNDKRDYLCSGQAKQQKVDINMPILLDTEFQVDFSEVKLEDKQIYGLAIEKEEGQKASVIAKQLTLSLAHTRSERFCDITNETDLEVYAIKESALKWFGNTCFGLHIDNDATTFFKISLDSKNMVELAKNKEADQVFDAFLDKSDGANANSQKCRGVVLKNPGKFMNFVLQAFSCDIEKCTPLLQTLSEKLN